MRPEWHTEMSTGGVWWFTDLTAFDPYYAFPVLTGLTTLVMMEMQSMVTGITPGFVMKWAGRFMALFFMFFASRFPMGVNVYWVTSAVLNIFTTALFQIGSVRKLARILPKQKPAAPRVVELPQKTKVVPDIQRLSRVLAKKRH